MLDKPSPLAEESLAEMTERWIAAFGAALANGSARALSELFAADSHWRNLFGVSWHFATFSGQATLVSEWLGRAPKGRATRFPIDKGALRPPPAGYPAAGWCEGRLLVRDPKG